MDHSGHDHHDHDHRPDRDELEATLERLIRAAVDEPRAELVRTRIRFRVLYDLMVERDRGFAREFGRRYREAMTRDFQPLWDQLVTHDAAAFAAEHGEWLAGEERHSGRCWATSCSRSSSASGTSGAIRSAPRKRSAQGRRSASLGVPAAAADGALAHARPRRCRHGPAGRSHLVVLWWCCV